MKSKIFLFIFLAFLFSCSVMKKKSEPHPSEQVEYAIEEYQEEELVLEAYPVTVGVEYEVEEIVDALELTDEDIIRDEIPNPTPSSVIEAPTQPNYIKGKIAYTVQDTMKVGEDYRVNMRITKDLLSRELAHNISNEPVRIVIESIRVGNVMSAQLIDTDPEQDNFLITSLSTEEQNIEEHGYTEWSWSVKPLKAGHHPLKLLVKVRVFTDDGDYLKDIPVFERKIQVHSNTKFAIGKFWNNNWQYMISTLIIPFLVWLWNRRKKKQE